VGVEDLGRLNSFHQASRLAKTTDAAAGDIVLKGSANANPLQAKVKDKTDRREYSKEDIKSAISKAEQMAVIFDRALRFKYIEEANIYQVHVIDTIEDKIIRKIPPDELVHFIAAVNEMLGALFDAEI